VNYPINVYYVYNANYMSNMNMRVSTAEFIKNYGTLADKALMEPVTITKNGRDRLVMVSAEEFERLKRRDRRVVRIEDWTEEEFAQMSKGIEQMADDGRNAELDGWKP
jgi:PHD/YefM family antitoxin component YafN of YafNO toxin-antitoxin module